MIKHRLMPLVARLITSEGLQQLRRRFQEWRRKLRREPHRAVFYFRIDDPYSVLMAQVLPRFARHFGMTITPKVMLYLDQQMYPAADMLAELAPPRCPATGTTARPGVSRRLATATAGDQSCRHPLPAQA